MNIEYEKKLGKNIRFLREKANLTQECLSAQMQINGTAPTTYRVQHQ